MQLLGMTWAKSSPSQLRTASSSFGPSRPDGGRSQLPDPRKRSLRDRAGADGHQPVGTAPYVSDPAYQRGILLPVAHALSMRLSERPTTNGISHTRANRPVMALGVEHTASTCEKISKVESYRVALPSRWQLRVT